MLFWKLLGETVFRRMRYFERSLRGPIPPLNPRPGLTAGEMPPEQWHELRLLRPELSLEEIDRRRRKGDRCFIGSVQGGIAHVGWVASRGAWAEALGAQIPLEGNACYFYGSFTVPEMRGHGIAPQVAQFYVQALRQAGFERVIAVVDDDNRSGLRALEKSGYQAAGWLGVLRLGPWRRLIRWNGPGPDRDASAGTESAYWSSVASRMGDHDYRRADPFMGRLKRRAHLRLLSAWASGVATGRTLKTDLFEEAGGADALLPSLIRSGGWVAGIDVSPQIVERARARLGDQASLIAADVRSLPFAASSFDLVISPSTLDHFHDPLDLVRSLREIRRVLRADGRLAITLDNRQNVLDWLLRALSRLRLTPYYLGRSYTVGQLRIALESAGFEVLAVTGILHSPRLTALAATFLAHRLNSRRLTRLVHRTLLRAQRLEHTRWAYFTASFVCAYARPRPATGEGQPAIRETVDKTTIAVSAPVGEFQ